MVINHLLNGMILQVTPVEPKSSQFISRENSKAAGGRPGWWTTAHQGADDESLEVGGNGQNRHTLR